MSKVINGTAWFIVAILILIQLDVDGELLIHGHISLMFSFLAACALGIGNFIASLKE